MQHILPYNNKLSKLPLRIPCTKNEKVNKKTFLAILPGMLKPDAYTLTSVKISGYSKQRQDYHLNNQQFPHAVYLFRDT